MATQAALPKITILPPGPERPELHFDQRLRSGKMPVSVDFRAGGEVESNQLSYEDYRGMSTQIHKLESFRRLDKPLWAMSDDLLRAVLVRYMEDRAMLKGPQPGSEKERLARAQKKLADLRAPRITSLQRLCAEYKSAAPERKQKLAQEIANVDTQLRTEEFMPALVIGTVHAYYRRGLDSVATAEELGLRPPHVRQLLWRLHRTWEHMNEWRGPNLRINLLGMVPKGRLRKDVSLVKQINAEAHNVAAMAVHFQCSQKKERKPFDAALAAKMYAAGRTLDQIGTLFGCQGVTVSRNLLRAGLYNPRPKGRRPGTHAR
jgi:hypothetical protein